MRLVTLYDLIEIKRNIKFNNLIRNQVVWFTKCKKIVKNNTDKQFVAEKLLEFVGFLSAIKYEDLYYRYENCYCSLILHTREYRIHYRCSDYNIVVEFTELKTNKKIICNEDTYKKERCKYITIADNVLNDHINKICKDYIIID